MFNFDIFHRIDDLNTNYMHWGFDTYILSTNNLFNGQVYVSKNKFVKRHGNEG